MEKQIRITIRLSSSTYAKLLKSAANYEGNVSMTIRKLIEKEKIEGNTHQTSNHTRIILTGTIAGLRLTKSLIAGRLANGLKMSTVTAFMPIIVVDKWTSGLSS